MGPNGTVPVLDKHVAIEGVCVERRRVTDSFGHGGFTRLAFKEGDWFSSVDGRSKDVGHGEGTEQIDRG